MPFINRLRSALEHHPSTAVSHEGPAQPNEAQDNHPLPQTREVGGALAGLKALKRHLPGGHHVAPRAPMPHTSPLDANQTGGGFGVSLSPFRARGEIRASHIAPAIAPKPSQLRTPRTVARMPMHVDRQRRADVKTSVGEHDRTEAAAVLELHHEDAADDHLRGKFPDSTDLDDVGRAAFEQQQSALLRAVRDAIPLTERGQPPLSKARYLGHALAEACNGEVSRAMDALRVLQGAVTVPTRQQQQDALLTRSGMARSRASFNALRNIETAGPLDADHLPLTQLEQKVHGDADWQTYRSADVLLDAWPPGISRPDSLHALAEAANAALPPADRAADVGVADGPDQAAISLALGEHVQAAMAFLCGRALLANPRAQPETRFRSAYLAQRNGIREGDLAQVQSRMFSLAKHARRNATGARTGNWIKRAAEHFGNGVKHSFGYHKDPLSTLNMGTAGGMLDHPEKDFSTLQSIDAVVDRLNDIVTQAPGTLPGQAPNAAALQAALRASALRHWKAGIGTKGWLRDDTRFGRFQRRRIAADAARALHTDPRRLRNSAEFKSLPTMNAATLTAWAIESRAVMDTPVVEGGKTLRENLKRMQVIRQDPIPTPVDPRGNIDSLCHLIENVPKTWSVQMSSGGVHGLDANISENLAAALGLVGLPSASVAPDVRYLKGRHAVLEVGSTSHHGELFIGTDNRRSAHLGVGAFIGWSLTGGKVMASGYGSALGGRDSGSPRGVVIRTPFEQTAHPDDVDAWRLKMQQVVHTLGESGAGGRLPETKEEMWNGLAHTFFADPDLSVGWVDNHSRTNYGAVSVSGGARYVTPANVKFGPLVSAEAVAGYSKAHAVDKSGLRTVDKISRGFRAAVNGSATLVASPLPVPVSSHGPFNSISFSSAPLVGVGTTLMQTGTGSALRLYEVDGQIVPERTFRDTEFTKVKKVSEVSR